MSISTKQSPEIWKMILYSGDTWPAYNFNVMIDTAPASGFTVLMQVRKSIAGDIVKTLSGGSGLLIASNNVSFDTIVDIPVGAYVYDIQITLSNGEVHTQYSGVINVKADVTR